MDCVTCLLLGVCMLCGQNFGAASSGRPMTNEEVDRALQAALRLMNTGNTGSAFNSRGVAASSRSGVGGSSINSYRRQSKLDPRFGQIGIGKRRGPKLDPYNFSFGLGKRDVIESTDTQRDFELKIHEPVQMDSTGVNYGNPITGALPEGTHGLYGTASIDKAQQSHSGIPSFLIKHILETESESKVKEFLDEEKRKLKERRHKHRLDPFLTMAIAGS